MAFAYADAASKQLVASITYSNNKCCTLRLRDVLLNLHSKPRKPLTRVAIYGAGAAGVRLAVALRPAKTHIVEMFVDDDPALWKRAVNGVPIESPEILFEKSDQVDQVLLAIPSLSRCKRVILDVLQESGIPVLQIPSLDEITSGRARIDSCAIQVEELLGRDPVPPDPCLLGRVLRAFQFA